jgi:DNA-binding response OmpR family regulator
MAQASVLFVDDDAELAEMLCALARRQGWQAITAATGQAADAALAAGLPQLVVLDMLLSDAHGADLCRRWRQQYPGLRILVLSATEPAWLGGGYDHAGADGWLTKPVPSRQLVASCQRLLEPAPGRG